MNGKQLGSAFLAGLVAGVIIYLYDATVGPMVQTTVTGVVGGVTK